MLHGITEKIFFFLGGQSASEDFGDTQMCQMHDLMHDLAQVVGDECLLVNGPLENVHNNVRHVQIQNASSSESLYRTWLLASSHIQSYFQNYDHRVLDVNDIFSFFRRLCVLPLDDSIYRLVECQV